MFEWNEDLVAGDRVTWWADNHGQGLPANSPGARQRHGIIDSAIPHPLYPTTVVAYTVLCESIGGRFLQTLRPDRGHQPRREN